MNLQELRSLLEANEHAAAIGAVERIRFHTLEARLERAEEAAEKARRELHDYKLSENDELNRLRADKRRLELEVAALQKALLLAGPGAPAPAKERVEPNKPAKMAAKVTEPRQAPRVRAVYPRRGMVNPAALAIMSKPEPGTGAYDRAVPEEDDAL